LSAGRSDGRAHSTEGRGGGSSVAVTFATPVGAGALLAHWGEGSAPHDATALMEDAANSLRLAHERRESERARQETTALRRSQQLQRGFLSRLSHELRTPLTAIGGFASSLMQPDVTWDGESEQRFLSRIGAESARLNRLVDDLLDFSAIESSTLRLQPDWCELALVLDAAIACVVPSSAGLIELRCASVLPVVWADHDRLEQVFVNLIENALRHNPAGTRVWVAAGGEEPGGVVVSVTDDGSGVPEEIVATRLRLAAGVDLQQHRRRHARALRRRLGGDRRHEPLRGPRQDGPRPPWSGGHRGHRQRHGLDRPRRRHPVHDHRPGPPRRRDGRRRRPPRAHDLSLPRRALTP
jgi:hypothetical protein